MVGDLQISCWQLEFFGEGAIFLPPEFRCGGVPTFTIDPDLNFFGLSNFEMVDFDPCNCNGALIHGKSKEMQSFCNNYNEIMML